MSRYSLQRAAAMLGTGRSTLCQRLRELGMLDANNLATRPHTSTGRMVVELRAFEHPGLGECQPYGKTFITRRGLLYIAAQLDLDIRHQPSPESNDDAVS